MDAITIGQRFKSVRKELGLTQSQMADKINAGKSTADIERGKLKISGAHVIALMEQYNINPLWLFGKSKQKYMQAHKVPKGLPQVITVDQDNNENVLLVTAKAAAGYADNIRDEQYYQSLPAFSIPLPEFRNASFRGFQISGDSMVPLVNEQDWVLAKAVDQLHNLKSGKVYVFVEQESIRLKQYEWNEASQTHELHSFNAAYPPVALNLEDVLECWEYHSKITVGLPTELTQLNKLERQIELLQASMAELKHV